VTKADAQRDSDAIDDLSGRRKERPRCCFSSHRMRDVPVENKNRATSSPMTAIPDLRSAEFRGGHPRLFESELTNVKRLLLYVDVCHAAASDRLCPRRPDQQDCGATLSPEDMQMFGLLAAQTIRPQEGVNTAVVTAPVHIFCDARAERRRRSESHGNSRDVAICWNLLGCDIRSNRSRISRSRLATS